MVATTSSRRCKPLFDKSRYAERGRPPLRNAVQRHVEAAVFKTVNLPAAASVQDVKQIYLDAWRAGVKGISPTATEANPGKCSPSSGNQPSSQRSTWTPRTPEDAPAMSANTEVGGAWLLIRAVGGQGQARR